MVYGGRLGGGNGPLSASLLTLGPACSIPPAPAVAAVAAVAAVVACSCPHAAAGAANYSWYNPTISSKLSASASWMSKAPALMGMAGLHRCCYHHRRCCRCRRHRHRCHRCPRHRCCCHCHRHHHRHRRLCRCRRCPHCLCLCPQHRSRHHHCHHDCTPVLLAIAPPPLWPIAIMPPQLPSPIVTPAVAHCRHRCSLRLCRHPAIHCAVASVAHHNCGWL